MRGPGELINPKCMEVLDRTAEQLKGRDWVDLAVPSHARERARETFRRLMAGDDRARRVHREPGADARRPRARDRLAQRRGTRRQRPRHGHDLQRRGRHRAPRGRGGDRPPRLPRPPHRAAEPDAAGGAPRDRAGPARRARATASRCCTSTSTTSSSSTTARPRGRRSGAGRGGRAAAGGHARHRPARAPGRRRVPAAADRPGRRPGGPPAPWPPSSLPRSSEPFTLDGASSTSAPASASACSRATRRAPTR